MSKDHHDLGKMEQLQQVAVEQGWPVLTKALPDATTLSKLNQEDNHNVGNFGKIDTLSDCSDTPEAAYNTLLLEVDEGKLAMSKDKHDLGKLEQVK